MNVEEFRKLSEVKLGKGKIRVVEWDKVLEEVKGKIVFNKDVLEKLVSKMYKGKNKLSYSEMYRVLKKWINDGLKVECRRDEKGRVWYLVE